jgi:uncharacterized protein affecting Mg2+/Co2+ transport
MRRDDGSTFDAQIAPFSLASPAAVRRGGQGAN